ncbi:MAG TPA: ComF family protein [Lacibacter sp.]|nr:ComF family protein [Lacibacter sp.]
MINARKWLNDFAHLFFPHHCAGCGSDLVEDHQHICHQCYTTLPETYFAPHTNNPIEKIFYGRVPVSEAMAAYYFSKQSVLQQLIHTLKYRNNQEVGLQLGRWMGGLLKLSGRFTTIDALIPLPLFPEKEKRRGYNQATVLCNGIAEVINIPVVNDFVLRKRYTDTQTKKGRIERWKNVDGSFEVNDSSSLKPKHVLLVDDVITTGATLEACGTAIVESGTNLSIAVLAWASDD